MPDARYASTSVAGKGRKTISKVGRTRRLAPLDEGRRLANISGGRSAMTCRSADVVMVSGGCHNLPGASPAVWAGLFYLRCPGFSRHHTVNFQWLSGFVSWQLLLWLYQLSAARGPYHPGVFCFISPGLIRYFVFLLACAVFSYAVQALFF